MGTDHAYISSETMTGGSLPTVIQSPKGAEVALLQRICSFEAVDAPLAPRESLRGVARKRAHGSP